jgi:hypothetical protein
LTPNTTPDSITPSVELAPLPTIAWNRRPRWAGIAAHDHRNTQPARKETEQEPDDGQNRDRAIADHVKVDCAEVHVAAVSRLMSMVMVEQRRGDDVHGESEHGHAQGRAIGYRRWNAERLDAIR